MKDRKKRLFPDYELIENDDIRTIPDFYDNLYPSFENFATSCTINAPKKSIPPQSSSHRKHKSHTNTKNAEKHQNNEN